jgi:hypothetical protein
MGSLYRDKKSSGCAMCKPHKHGWAKKFKNAELDKRRIMNREIEGVILNAMETAESSTVVRRKRQK